MSPTPRKFALLLSLVLVGLFALPALAQDATSGAISGTITDSSGAVVKGAQVTIVNTDRKAVERTLSTNGAGFYTARSLPLGLYTVKIAATGFSTINVTGLHLNVADSLTVNHVLLAGAVSETINVSADEARVNLEDATSAGLIDFTQLNELPLLTRNYESLINLQPGVSFGGASDQLSRGPSGLSGASSTVAFSVNGGRTSSNGWTIDGADNLDRGSNLTLYVYPSPDAIAQFKTLRGQYSAQFGRNASGQVDVVTKSGSNQIHGSLYDYIRNDAFAANGFANNYLGLKIPELRYNIGGGSLGGPVYIPHIYDGRDKTFFFVSEELQRIVQTAQGVSALVPQASERAGDFTQSGQKVGTQWTTGPVTVCTAYTTNPTTQVNTCTATGTQVTNISPTAQAYLNDIYKNIPVPNVAYNLAHNIDPHTILSSFKSVFNNLDSVVRIDQQLSQKLNVFYRYVHDTFPEVLPQGQFTTVPIPGANTTIATNAGTQQLGHVTYAPTGTLVVNGGYAYSNGNIVSTPSGFLASSLSPSINVTLPYADTVGLVPGVSVSGSTALSGSIAYAEHSTNNQVFADVTKVLGRNTVIVGFSFNHYAKTENNTTGTQGGFTFANDAAFSNVPSNTNGGANEAQGFANLLTGNANGGFSQLSRDPVTNIRGNLYEAYLQDNWKATPKLTLNIGVRYAYYGQPYDANGLLSNFDPATYSAAAAPTISTTGLICFTGTCSQANSNAGQATTPNASADYVGINYINGLIFGNPGAANNNQASPYGLKVGQAQKDNFAPRVGFAYDVFGDGKTALRGGYGWSFDDAEVSFYETTVFNNPPAVATYSVGQTSFDNPTGGALTAISTTPGRVQAVPLNYRTPYVQQFSLDVQQQVTPTLLFDIGYFGTHGAHLLGGEDANQPAPGAWVGKIQPSNSGSACIDPDTGTQSFLNSTCDRPLNQIKPYLGYFSVDTLRTIFNSNYNSLQVKATKRFKGKTYIDANYTWSRDLTNAQADGSFIQNIYNPNGEYGRAAVDRTNVINLDGVYELPFFRGQKGLVGHLLGGWEITGIYAIDSGLPLTVSASGAYSPSYNLPAGTTSVFNGRTSTGYITDNAGLSVFSNTTAGLRLNQLGNPNNGYGTKIHNKGYNSLWFYTGAYAAAPPSQTAIAPTAQRGTIEGPGFNRLDAGVYRSFRLYERLTFTLRAEAYNALNHTNVQSVTTAAGSASTFGEVTGYRDARIVQFAGRFQF
jgi:hypothetical protein